MNSIFHDYSTLQKVVDIRYECRNQIYLVHIGPKRSNLAKKRSSTMVNLIVYWFSQFLGKIITFLTLITNFLAWNFLVIENFAWNFTRGPYIAFSWVPSRSKLTWNRSKLCCKSLKCNLLKQFFLITEHPLQILTTLAIERLLSILVFVARSQTLTILWLLEGSNIVQKTTFLLEKRYKNAKTVTFIVPQT